MKEYIEKHRERMLGELFGLLRIPSVSASASHKEDMRKTAELYASLLRKAGADKADVYDTKGHPVVFAEKFISKELPTILVYAHYDVQPSDPDNLWISPPFEPQVRDGAIYARGANDDKGQGFMHVKAFEYLNATNQLKCNVKFIIDGEEEIGSPSLPEWADAHKELLACDEILVSDTTMIDENIPSLNVGMRGLAYLEVEVDGPNKDLHSGHYGGAILNPLNTLCKMVASLIDEKGKITIPGFYDDVIELSADDRAMLAKAPFNEKEYKEFLNIDAVAGEEGYSTMERTGIRPSLDVNGIWGGYTGEGAKTVLPSKAFAKISMRLVPDQDNKKIAELFEKHFKSLAPKGVTVKVKPHHGGQGFLCPMESKMYKSAVKAITDVYGIEPVPTRGGGSIPILADLQQILGANPLLMGFGLERDVIHSPNESYLLKQLFRGMESIALFYKYYCGE
jgi:acetylornithine deacetylase/succinyl-diaminopimelate desuccinylase-like protein